MRVNGGKRPAVVDPPLPFDYYSHRSRSTDSFREATAELGVGEGAEDMSNEWEVQSVATELVDEDGESELRRRPEVPLPNLPYDQIMRKVSREPTLILSE